MLIVLTWCGAWSLLPLRVFGTGDAGAQHPLAPLPSVFGPGGAAAIFCRPQWRHPMEPPALTWPPLPQRAFTPKSSPCWHQKGTKLTSLSCHLPSPASSPPPPPLQAARRGFPSVDQNKLPQPEELRNVGSYTVQPPLLCCRRVRWTTVEWLCAQPATVLN